MNEILDLATKLGRAIAKHPRFIALKEAEEKIEKDEQAKKLMDDLQKQSQKVAELEANMKPIEPEDKKELQRLQQEMALNPNVQQFSRAQADYTELMLKVNQCIESELGGGEHTLNKHISQKI